MNPTMHPTMARLTQTGWKTSCFMSLLAFAFNLYNNLNPQLTPEIIDAEKLQPVYDFVVIGAGSAGSVVANRLSEVGKWTVLLLEAGGPETEYTDVPALAEEFQGTTFDWQYKTAPPKGTQRYCLAMTNHICYWPKGKAVGGSSVINTMIYTRGNREDYDNWERMGNTGWGYDNVLKYFKKSEDNTDPQLVQTPYHSRGGPQTVENIRFWTPMADVFLEGGKYLGYDIVDYNGRNQTGFRMPQGTSRNGARCSTSKGFILPAQKRPTLDISFYTYVTGIGFEDEEGTPTAKTVYFLKNYRKSSVKARKEVILCAGSIGSPQLLMLSGIGPKEHLRDHGIKVIKDLKVGQNLQDHLFTYLWFTVDKRVTLFPADVENADTALEYVADRQGPLTSLVRVEGVAFVNTKYANRSGTYPDIEFRFSPAAFLNNEPPLGVTQYNLRPDLFNGTGFNNLQNTSIIETVVINLRPESKGQLTLASTDPFDQPIIDPNYLSEQEDVDVTIAGQQLALKLAATPPFQKYKATPLPFHFPGCEKFRLYSPEYMECTFRQFTRSSNHPSCTCPMGVTSFAVVDPRLRVYGVRGLRVIDASVMPKLPSAHTNAPVIMIAEKGCDLIKEDWRVEGFQQSSRYVAEGTW